MVLDGETELVEDAADARGPQRRRSHQRAGLRGADLDGDAEQGDAGVDFGFGHRAAFKDIAGWASEACPLLQRFGSMVARKGALPPYERRRYSAYALKYAICVVVASRRPDGDHNSPFWSP